MSRPKEFDEAEVLDQAVELFRARGFKHTSFSDLTAELGVSRQSLYDTYGDKHTLYHTALRHYLARGADCVERQLAAPGPVRDAFRHVFENLIANQCADGAPGCLMVNAMVELSPHEGDIRALAQQHARTMEGLFARRLSEAQRHGEIPPDRDPVALARFLYHTILGLAVASRALGETASLRETAALALRALD